MFVCDRSVVRFQGNVARWAKNDALTWRSIAQNPPPCIRQVVGLAIGHVGKFVGADVAFAWQGIVNVRPNK